MTVHSIKTDNANISHKVYLRRLATKDLPELRVLDCFAGENRIWKNLETSKYYGIEKVKGKGANLNADNERVIASLDLSQFNVIDFDSYGIPCNVMQIAFDNPSLRRGTVIIYTCIGNAMSTLPKSIVRSLGIERMYAKAPSLFNKHGDEYFYGMLSLHGVKRVHEYRVEGSFKKRYGYFIY